MASPAYSTRVIVLRKTKLGEADVIATLLAEDGRQISAVAKGARKPTSPFSSRLELFAEVDALLVSGRNLDIVKEARLVEGHWGIVADVEHAAAAAPIIDLASRLTHSGLEMPRIFPLTSSALSHAEAADSDGALVVCAAYMLKAFSFAGFRPSFDRCVCCGKAMPLQCSENPRAEISFSAAEGGVVCPQCLLYADARRIPLEVLSWSHCLLMSTFDDALASPPPTRVVFEIFHLCQSWMRAHVGNRLKSLDFLCTCGLF